MTPPFNLKDFEFSLDPSVWDAAQDIAASGAVKALREVEPKFWVALVDADTYRYEVEILLSAQRVKGLTCECRPHATRMRACAHSAAVILKLRQYFEKEKVEKERLPQPVSRSYGPSRLTVQTVLSHVDPEKLIEFVREWAQNDRDFSLALKTRFAAELPGSADFFEQLLTTALLPLKNPEKIRDADFRRLMRSLEDLDKQMAAEMRSENWPAAVQIASAVLAKLPPTVSKMTGPRKMHAEKIATSVFQKLLEIGATDDIAPYFEEEIWQSALGLVAQRGLLPSMASNASTLDFFVEKTSATPSRLVELEMIEKEGSPEIDTFWPIFLLCLAKKGEKKPVFELLTRASPQGERLLKLLRLLVERGFFELAKSATNAFLADGAFSGWQKMQADELLFLLAEKTGDRLAQVDFMRSRFMASGNFDHFQKLKKLAADDWAAEVERLLSALKSEKPTAETARRIAGILAVEGHAPVLTAFLLSENRLELAQEHEAFLLKNAPDSLEQLYSKLLETHLTDHLGRNAAEKAADVLTNLKKRSPERAVEIARGLLQTFADRQTVIAELIAFLPKEEKIEWLRRLKTSIEFS